LLREKHTFDLLILKSNMVQPYLILILRLKKIYFQEGQRSAFSRSHHRPRKVTGSNLNNSVTMDVDVDNDLQCPICLELYTYPIILPCSHVLCRSPCAEHLFDFNFIRCPVCRDNCYVSGGISSLPRVIALENIIERYNKEKSKAKKGDNSGNSVVKQTQHAAAQGSNEDLVKSLTVLNDSVSALTSLTSSLKSSPDVKCQQCTSAQPKRAKKYCVACRKHYCASCLRQSHPNKEPFTSHEFVDPREENHIDSSPLTEIRQNGTVNGISRLGSGRSQMSSASIGVHQDAYCSLCMQPFKSNSDEGSIHSGHPVVALEQAYREFKVFMCDS